MNASLKVIYTSVTILVFTVLLAAFQQEKSVPVKFAFPYKQSGLTERQAAAHLLSRFTYGAKPGEIDMVVKTGLEQWFEQQLTGKLKEGQLDKLLLQFEDINLTNSEVENKYPRNPKVLRMAIRDGAINQDSVNRGDQKAYRKQLDDYMQANGLKPEYELYRQFINQKIVRAAYTNNQLRELLTDFWFNHFNVSLTKNQCASFVPAFERDVIRPNVSGKFQDLLLATAKSPAMLIYLDNFSSTGDQIVAAKPVNLDMEMMGAQPSAKPATPNKPKQQQNKKKSGGLNENYAREIMELHTLGVDGGYSQNDVTQAAKVLTGWTLAPMGEDGYGAAMQKIIDKVGEANLQKQGFVREGDFLFVPSRHDNSEKTVLGKKFAPGGGYEEGVALLSMLAHHQSTAKFISKKIATRFVSDNPSQKLVDKMAKTFRSTEGNIREVMVTMVSSPEFWKADAIREKTKSPFELAMSAVRSLNAEITQPYQLFNWINRMGQKMYYYQAPTGFPDRGQYWINTGALLNRMNFGLALASQRIPGVKISLASLNNNHEPESAEAALLTYSKLMLPERNLQETVKRLKPMLNDPQLVNKVQKAADKTPVPQQHGMAKETTPPAAVLPQAKANNNMLAQVVGIIIGSPEFQRK